VEEDSETGVSPHRGPIGEPGDRGLSTRNFENCLKEGSNYRASLSTGALLEEQEGGHLFWGTLQIMKGRLWIWASLFMGAQLGNLE